MIVCKADISPYRRAYQQHSIAYGLLPDDLFSWTEDYFDDMRSPDLLGASDAETLNVKVVFAFLHSVPELTVIPTWIAIRHQAGGYACEQHRFIATELNVRQELIEGLSQMARDRRPGGRAGWNGHGNLANLRGNTQALNAYRSELAEIGLQYSGDWITEGIYPIDAAQTNLDALCEEKLSLWELGLGGTDNAAVRAAVLVIVPNSD